MRLILWKFHGKGDPYSGESVSMVLFLRRKDGILKKVKY